MYVCTSQRLPPSFWMYLQLPWLAVQVASKWFYKFLLRFYGKLIPFSLVKFKKKKKKLNLNEPQHYQQNRFQL